MLLTAIAIFGELSNTLHNSSLSLNPLEETTDDLLGFAI
jgi:hypothetical protein